MFEVFHLQNGTYNHVVFRPLVCKSSLSWGRPKARRRKRARKKERKRAEAEVQRIVKEEVYETMRLMEMSRRLARMKARMRAKWKSKEDGTATAADDAQKILNELTNKAVGFAEEKKRADFQVEGNNQMEEILTAFQGGQVLFLNLLYISCISNL